MIAVARHPYTPAKPLKIRWDRASIFAGLIAFWTVVAVSCAHAGEMCEAPRVVGQFRCDFMRARDGDTGVCQSGEVVRLFGIDSVERGQPGYAEAGLALTSITREPIECRMLYRDRYRRAVAMCYNSKGDLGRQLLSAGFAVEYWKYSRGYYSAACWGGWK